MTTFFIVVLILLHLRCVYQRYKMRMAIIEAFDAIAEYTAMADEIRFGDTDPTTAEDTQ